MHSCFSQSAILNRRKTIPSKEWVIAVRQRRLLNNKPLTRLEAFVVRCVRRPSITFSVNTINVCGTSRLFTTELRDTDLVLPMRIELLPRTNGNLKETERIFQNRRWIQICLIQIALANEQIEHVQRKLGWEKEWEERRVQLRKIRSR